MNSNLIRVLLLNLLIVQVFTSTQDIFTADDCLADDSTEDRLQQAVFNCTSINPLLFNCTCRNDYIDCSNKGFTSIPTNLTQLPKQITRLFFAKNSIRSLSKLNLNNSTRINVLSLKRNQIESIDADFFDNLASDLDFLSFCGNSKLSAFIQLKQNFTSLKELELNNLKELNIQDGFFTSKRFPHLERLDLNNANLKYDKKPFELTSILVIRLDSNNLDNLPCESFSSMTQLQTLNLTNNNLNKLVNVSQSCLQKLTSLKDLHLKSNDLRDENLLWFEFGSTLSVLDLSNNRLTRFPYKSLQTATNLTHLRININSDSSTFASKQETNVIYWPNLVYLDMSNSNISILPDYAFTNFSNSLTDLILSNCKLKLIKPDAFAFLNKLIYLDLSRNLLQSLSKPTDLSNFDYNSLNGNIKLNNNNFRCNQLDVEWFIQFYSYSLFNQNLTCSLFNETKLNLKEYLQTHRVQPDKPVKSSNILSIILFVLIILVMGTTVFYLIRRKQVKQRQQQYRYRFFTERQDDGFDTDSVPVYRDCTVSLRIKDTDDVNNSTNNNNNNNNSNLDTSSTAALTEQRSDLIRN